MVVVHQTVIHHLPELGEPIGALSPAPPEPLAVHLVVRPPQYRDVLILEDFEISGDGVDLLGPHAVHLGAFGDELFPLGIGELALRLNAEVHPRSAVEGTVHVPHEGDDVAAVVLVLCDADYLRGIPREVASPYHGDLA